jgi:putative copper resistance protein D
MSLLADIFGYLTVVLHGFSLVAETLTLGGIAFLLLLALPFAAALGEGGVALRRRSFALLAWSAFAAALLEAAELALNATVLASSLDLASILGAGFFEAGLAKILFCLALFVAALRPKPGAEWLLLVLGAGMMAASLAASHAAARLEDRTLLLGLTLLHRVAAGLWIGGIPYLLIGLRLCPRPPDRLRIGRRFSAVAVGAVAALLVGGLGLAFILIGSFPALYGTAYGMMVLTKSMLFLGLLFLGFLNNRLIRRLGRDPATPTLRLLRFCEVEIGIGVAVLLAAASITSLPPAIDLVQDRVTLEDYAARFAPRWPSFESPAFSSLAIAQRQAELDRTAAATQAPHHEAFVPGGTAPLPRNAADIAWSEYNHHWAGVFVLAIGLLALGERAGIAPWARHWPLLLLGLAFFLFFRSEAESWPIGELGFFESLRNPEFVQHKFFMLLIVLFGLFEWAVRTERLGRKGYALVFPLLVAGGAAFLLSHSHMLTNVKELLLAEVTHLPIALLGVAIAAARWLELRLEPPASRIAAWVWPPCFVLVGIILLLYRES